MEEVLLVEDLGFPIDNMEGMEGVEIDAERVTEIVTKNDKNEHILHSHHIPHEDTTCLKFSSAIDNAIFSAQHPQPDVTRIFIFIRKKIKGLDGKLILDVPIGKAQEWMKSLRSDGYFMFTVVQQTHQIKKIKKITKDEHKHKKKQNKFIRHSKWSDWCSLL